jgi:hypothetical protein
MEHPPLLIKTKLSGFSNNCRVKICSNKNMSTKNSKSKERNKNDLYKRSSQKYNSKLEYFPPTNINKNPPNNNRNFQADHEILNNIKIVKIPNNQQSVVKSNSNSSFSYLKDLSPQMNNLQKLEKPSLRHRNKSLQDHKTSMEKETNSKTETTTYFERKDITTINKSCNILI